MLDSSTPAGQAELALEARLLDQARDCLRRHRYSLRTEKVYVAWIQAARDARIPRPVSSHTSLHSFAAHLLESGTDIRK